VEIGAAEDLGVRGGISAFAAPDVLFGLETPCKCGLGAMMALSGLIGLRS
jgi:hypothetical protein